MSGQEGPTEAAQYGDRPTPGGVTAAGLTVFISYRRDDAGAHARLLYDRLAQRFGADNVFLDLEALQAGTNWREEIHSRASGSGVLLALIGPRWLSLVAASAQRGVLEPTVDVARQEIELALTSHGEVTVVPVLLDGTTMPPAHELPRSLQALADRQAMPLRIASYDEDVESLIAHLECLSADGGAQPARNGTPRFVRVEPIAVDEPPVVRVGVHHQRIAGLMRGAGHVVTVLGSGSNAGCEPLPSAEALAATLARRFAFEPASPHPKLAEVAEYVDRTWGTPDLYLSVKENLSVDFCPTSVHTFFAELPTMLERLGGTRRHQLILTTNYDTALERAFDLAQEPYDLAVYMASTGRFMHYGWETTPQPVTEPNRYFAFPVGDDLELTRTIIIKINGAVGGGAQSGGEDDYVITEDNYIDYLSGGSIEQIMPFQILQTLKSSHCLFLGYPIQDWNLRVALKRVWGPRVKASSWAVDEGATEFERAVWREFGAEVLTQPLPDFVDALVACLQAER
jgi:hypothetical protein